MKADQFALRLLLREALRRREKDPRNVEDVAIRAQIAVHAKLVGRCGVTS